MLFGNHVREAHSVGGEDAGEAVDEDARDAQLAGNGAGMLAPGSAEAGEDVFLGVEPAHHGDFADGPHHHLVGNPDEAQRDVLEAHFRKPTFAGVGVDLVGQCLKRTAGGVSIKRLVFGGSKDFGEVVWVQPSEDKVGVGDGKVAVFAVTHGAGMRPGRFRADLEEAVAEKKPRAAACRHSLDVHLRGLNADSSGFGFVREFVVGAVARHVGGSAAHVKADHGLSQIGGQRVAHHSAGGAGEDGVAALEVIGSGESAVGLHEKQLRGFQPVRKSRTEAVEVVADVRGQVGVHGGGVAPGDHLDHRHDLVRERNLREADLAGQFSDFSFVIRNRVGVGEHDGQCPDSGIIHRSKLRPNRLHVRLGQNQKRFARRSLNDLQLPAFCLLPPAFCLVFL